MKADEAGVAAVSVLLVDFADYLDDLAGETRFRTSGMAFRSRDVRAIASAVGRAVGIE